MLGCIGSHSPIGCSTSTVTAASVVRHGTMGFSSLVLYDRLDRSYEHRYSALVADAPSSFRLSLLRPVNFGVYGPRIEASQIRARIDSSVTGVQLFASTPTET